MDVCRGGETKRYGTAYRDVLTFVRTYLYAASALFVFAAALPAQDINTSTEAAAPSMPADTAAVVTPNDSPLSLIQIDSAAVKNKNDITDTIHYESDFVDYDNDNQILGLHGNARVRYQNMTLVADTIVYTVQTDQFHARGRPTLIDGKDTTVGDFMVYNIKTRRGRVSYAFTRFDDTFVTGSNIVKSPENCLYIEQGDYTTCQNPEHPHYYFYSRHIKVIPDDKVVSRPVIFNVGDAPVAVLPYFVMPLQRGRRSGWLTPSWGGSVSRGGYVDNLGYYFAPGDYYDLTLSTKVQEFNSFVFNTRGRYALRYTLEGEVSGRYVVDNRLETSSQQWAVDYRHNQHITPDGKTRLIGSGSIISNRTFNQLYSDQTHELEQQQLDANMSLAQRFDRINASANVTWRRNHNLTTDRIREDMPSFDFNLQNRAFIPFEPNGDKSEPSWYNNIYYSYNTKANVRRDVYGNDSLPGFIRPGMQHGVRLNSSQKILKYLDVSPYLNINSSMFLGAIDTLVKDTIQYRDTIVYTVRDPAADTRAPNYTPVGDPVMNIFRNEYGDLDTTYTITKVSPLMQHLVRDTLYNEFNAVTSWNAGVNFSTRIYGMFPIGVMGVTAIRHTMTPTVGYAFVPKHELDRTFYDVGISYDRARPKPQQLLNLSLSNTFQGKRIVSAKQPEAPAPPNRRPAAPNSLTDGKDTSVPDSSLVDNDAPVPDSSMIDDNAIAADSSLAVKDTAAAAPPARQREEKFDLLSLSLNTSYDFEADNRKWRDLNVNARTSVSVLNVSHTSSFWFYDGNDEPSLPILRNYSVDLTSRSLGVAGKFWDGDLLDVDVINGDPITPAAAEKPTFNTHSWNIGFSPSFSYRANRTSPDERFQPTRSFNVSSNASLQLTNAMSVRWNSNYDLSSGRFSHNNFTFYYDLECWEMRFTWRPEKINPGFHFVVNIKKIPDIKWEERESRTTRAL